MKKIILSAVAVFAFGFAQAQDKKESSNGGKGFTNGDIFISGSVGINSSKTGDFKTSDFNITPRVGFFVTDNIAIGASLGYMSSKIDAGDTATNSQFSVGVFGRYYATPASDFSVFAELGVNYVSMKNEYGVDTDGSLFATDSKPNSMEIALRPGVSYFLSDHFALEASIAALSYSSYDPDGGDKTTNFGLNVDLTNVNMGLIYKF